MALDAVDAQAHRIRSGGRRVGAAGEEREIGGLRRVRLRGELALADDQRDLLLRHHFGCHRELDREHARGAGNVARYDFRREEEGDGVARARRLARARDDRRDAPDAGGAIGGGGGAARCLGRGGSPGGGTPAGPRQGRAGKWGGVFGMVTGSFSVFDPESAVTESGGERSSASKRNWGVAFPGSCLSSVSVPP